MHTTMVPEQVKTMKIQAGIQVSRPRELTRQLQLWKRFGRLYLIVFVLVRNIVKKFDNPPSHDVAKDPTPRVNAVYHAHHENGAPQNKCKSPSKLLSPKYQSQSSLGEHSRNSSSPKRVYFVNTIAIMRKEDESRKAGAIETDSTKDDDYGTVVETCGETKEIEELEEEVEEKLEEEEDEPEYFNTFPTIKELSYHEWLLKNPRPPWVSAKIRTGNLNNIKISCMIGQFLKEQAYINLDSPINVMSKLNYRWIMSEGLKSRRNLSNPEKICNFVGKVKGLKVIMGNFTYKCDFVMLEDTTSVIDHYLGSMVLVKPFVKASRLVYNKGEGTVTLGKNNERITLCLAKWKGLNILIEIS
ncbi:hypothetical protein Tco_0972550 [Tanacetum coccineum]